MNPFSAPLSGTAGWIGIVLAVGAAVVLVIYLYQSFLPQLQRLLSSSPDPEERAAELLEQYRQKQRAKEKS